MKIKKTTFIVLLMAIVFSSCENYIPDDGDKNLHGNWIIDEVIQNEYYGGVLEYTEVIEQLGSINFSDDGSGTYSVELEGESASGSFDWFVKNDKLFMNLLTLSDSVWTDNMAIAWDVVSSTELQQNWEASLNQYVDEEDETGQMVTKLMKMEILVELSKN